MTPRPQHQRKYETLDKYILHLAGVLTVALLGTMTTIMYKTQEMQQISQRLQQEDHEQFVILNTTMSFVRDDLGEVKGNQLDLQNEVREIKGRVGKFGKLQKATCERGNEYWTSHKIECGE